uniref:Uncharacterized protein n=1 Tax=Octopus bimaculoides TaxID=37653 RepID=A0A0L8GZF0_OCTBM
MGFCYFYHHHHIHHKNYCRSHPLPIFHHNYYHKKTTISYSASKMHFRHRFEVNSGVSEDVEQMYCYKRSYYTFIMILIEMITVDITISRIAEYSNTARLNIT